MSTTPGGPGGGTPNFAELVSPTTDAAPGQEVEFALVNRGPGRIGHGTPFELERKEDDQWVRVEWGPENLAWSLVALSLPPGGRFEQSVEIPKDAPPGRYRVWKDVDGIEGNASFEFNVTPASSSA